MKRPLLRSSAFVRAAKKALKKNPELAGDLQSSLGLLEVDAFHPRLKTHKLAGQLRGSWACAAGYDLRIIFKLVDYQGQEAILLESI